MNKPHQRSSLREADQRWHPRPSVIWICLACLIGASLACSLPSDQSSDSVAATQLSLEVEATTLALEKARLTREAAAQDQVEPPPLPVTEEPPAEDAVEDTATPTEEATEESPEAVEGSLVRASFDPAYGWGSGHDSDNFDGPTGLFPASSAGAATAWYADGRYNIAFTTRSRWTWYWSSIDVEDFYVDVVVFNGDKCVPGDTAGIMFRGHSVADYGMMFGISCGGEYFIGVTAVPGATGPICSWGGGISVECTDRDLAHSDLIQTGPGAINRIGVMVKGLEVDYYINGKWVDERTLPPGWPVSVHGQFSLYLGTAQSSDASVSFDDFSAWYLD